MPFRDRRPGYHRRYHECHMDRRTAVQLLACAPFGAAAADARQDSFGDGWPDSLRLRDRADQEAFRSWCVWLAESLWASQPRLPREVTDCSSLLRFCAKEALRRHDGAWAASLGLEDLPPLPEVRQYSYPTSLLGGAFFRTRPGPLRESDFRARVFREFADAEHLMSFNTFPLGRSVRLARPGDLLFYRQLDDFQPFHSMIAAGDHAVYHTGPIGRTRGEMRRPAIAELLRHEEPRWRPLEGNSNFLGVFRWNLLRESS